MTSQLITESVIEGRLGSGEGIPGSEWCLKVRPGKVTEATVSLWRWCLKLGEDKPLGQ